MTGKPLAVIITTVTVACSSPSEPRSVALNARLELTGPETLAPAQTAEFKLLEIAANGRSREVTQHASWTSSNDAVLAIDPRGLATTRNRGEARITAAIDNRTSALIVVVVPTGTYAVKGTVVDADTGVVLAGTRVEALSDGRTLLETVTDGDGRYQLYGVPGNAELRVSREGFTSDLRSLAISNHATVEVRLARPAPEGLYTLTVDAGSACSFPPDVRIRTYTAKVESWRPGNYLVTLSDATFLEPPECSSLITSDGCNQFSILREGERLRVAMWDFGWGYGGHIVEKLPGDTWILLSANGAGRVEGSTLEFLAVGDVLHCPVAQNSLQHVRRSPIAGPATSDSDSRGAEASPCREIQTHTGYI